MNTLDPNLSGSANEAAIYNLLMYLPFTVDDGMSLQDIVAQITNKSVNWKTDDEKFDRLKRLVKAIETYPDLGNSVIGNQIDKDGLSACTFTNNGKAFVVYRGTGDGEWIDNGEALSGIPEENTYYTFDEKGHRIGKNTVTEYASDQQAQALNYFNQVAAKEGWSEQTDITVTGHSKGGNKSQFVTLNSELVDKCYSFDGQGFSPEAIQYYKDKYGEKYQDIVNKMYSFAADNDYVNVLGKRAVPNDHIYYFEAPLGDKNIAKYHYMESMLSDKDGTFNKQTEQGDISEYIEKQSNEIMKLDPEYRQFVTRGLMNVCQSILGEGDPVNGDYVSVKDMIQGIGIVSLPLIYDLFRTPEGRKALIEIYNNIGKEKGTLYEVGAVILSIGIVCIFAPLIEMVYKLSWITTALDNIIDSLVELGEEIINSVKDYLNNLVKNLSTWYNSTFNAGYRYATENPYIKLSTYKLRSYADRIKAVNSKIVELDHRLDGLYSRFSIWDWWTIAKVDICTEYSWKLERCRSYLNDTADEFEAVELKLLSQAENV